MRRAANRGPAGDFFSWKTAVIAGMIVTAAGVGYLAEVSAATAKGYQIRGLEKQVSDLRAQTQKMELQVAEGQSVKSIESRVQGLGLVPTSQVEYLTTSAPVVARR